MNITTVVCTHFKGRLSPTTCHVLEIILSYLSCQPINNFRTVIIYFWTLMGVISVILHTETTRDFSFHDRILVHEPHVPRRVLHFWYTRECTIISVVNSEAKFSNCCVWEFAVSLIFYVLEYAIRENREPRLQFNMMVRVPCN